MEWQLTLALRLAVPIIPLPAAFMWYLTAGGALAAVRGARRGRAGKARETGTVVG